MASVFGNDVASIAFISWSHIFMVDDDLASGQHVSSGTQNSLAQEARWWTAFLINEMDHALYIRCPMFSYTDCDHAVVQHSAICVAALSKDADIILRDEMCCRWRGVYR